MIIIKIYIYFPLCAHWSRYFSSPSSPSYKVTIIANYLLLDFFDFFQRKKERKRRKKISKRYPITKRGKKEKKRKKNIREILHPPGRKGKERGGVYRYYYYYCRASSSLDLDFLY